MGALVERGIRRGRGQPTLEMAGALTTGISLPLYQGSEKSAGGFHITGVGPQRLEDVGDI